MKWSGVPHIEVTNSDLKARCTRCGKFIAYTQKMTVEWWKHLLATFVKKHRNCKGEP